MPRPHTLVLTGYGINCDEETKFAFEKAGAIADIVHINDLIDGIKKLSDYQVLAFAGGFSYGDDTGSGNALANKIRNHIWDEVRSFVDNDRLAIGICNGFQVMVNLGLLPALEGRYGQRQVALVHNDSARYMVRWVDLQFNGSSPWTRGLGEISLPIAHAEGKLYADAPTLEHIKQKGMIAAQYVHGEMCEYQSLKANPNGSLEDIAALQDETGRMFGMMPHPERAIEVTHLPNWPLLKEQCRRNNQDMPTTGPGLRIFNNAVKYFS